jgi:hypothetical protein
VFIALLNAMSSFAAASSASTGLVRYQHVPRTRPLFDIGNAAAASCLLNKLSTHRITGER